MGFLDQNPNNIWKLKDVVNSNTSLVDLMKKYGLSLEERQTGNFSHRLYCPFHKGKDGGRERTPSMFVSSKDNTFFCFGCGSVGRPVDFVTLMEGTPALIAIQKLAKDLGLIKKDGKWDELKIGSLVDLKYTTAPIKTIDPFILEMSALIRNYIMKYIDTDDFEKELRWIEKICRKLDIYLDRIGYEDWEDAQKLCKSLSKKIKDRIRTGEK